MQIYIIRVVVAQGVIRNNKIPATLSGHMQRSPTSSRPPSWSTSPWEASLPSYSSVQMSSAAWPLKISQLQSDQLGHFRLSTKVGSITFLSPLADTESVRASGTELCDVRSCTECLLFLKKYILTNYIIKSTAIQNDSHKD